jgi:tetratricopeptide (TPR) repeat protein
MHTIMSRRQRGLPITPQGPRGPTLGSRLALCCLLVTSIFIARPAWCDLWYQHYQRAEQALQAEDWAEAVEQLNLAIERRGDSGARVRTYGMRTTNYFPYLKLGLAYHGLGQYQAALQAFETEERLEAVQESAADFAELQRVRAQANEAMQTAAAEEQRLIQEILSASVSEAEDLASRGQLEEAIQALGKGLAVAPEDDAAGALMERLRDQIRQRDEVQAAEQRVARWLEEGSALLAQQSYGEASSLFRQALALQPQNVQAQRLLDEAQAALAAQLATQERQEDLTAMVREGMTAAKRLESDDRIAEALAQLESILAMQPENREAQELQARLLETQSQIAEEASNRQQVDAELKAAAGYLTSALPTSARSATAASASSSSRIAPSV